ncbi:unnamed protein product [Dicrocoelium dendriticum]|nr:unnamed protein product [Dicrocoelium dendriticum]
MAHAVTASVWLLPGETVHKDATISGGRLLLTDYRLLFTGRVLVTTWSVPLSLIAKVEVLDLCSLKFVSKLGLSFACEFASENECECWMDRIQQVAFKPGLDKDSFCFLFHDALCARIPDHPFLQCTSKLLSGTVNEKTPAKPSLPLDLRLSSGFNIVDAEYTRMKFGSPWRITQANGSFRICSSYPEYHIVPSDIEDNAIARMSEFRTHKRFPSVVWRSQTTGAVLLRTSEPRVGWMYNRNECDEQFMSSVSRSCMKDPGFYPPKAPTRLLIVDARTFRVAQLKRFLGGGYEYSGYYNEAELCFMDMPNLHAVRVSFERLSQLYAMETDANWFSTLEKTCWLNYISQLLKSSLDIAVAMESVGRPVMVHCTDGWDRTAQLSSLAQLLADPYYRTIEGFVILVEREWLQFGHKFADRCGHGDSYPSGDERSPIFLQWLDCVHQVRIQFPDQFEFNETFLVKLGLHVYSGMFGTFLCNSERCRQEADLDSRTCSVWVLLSQRYNWTITNQFYEASKQRLLEPDWRLPSLRLWNSLYRSALLPTRRITTGVVTLNSSPENASCSVLGESDSHVDQQSSASLRPARASSPEINSCGGSSSADRLLGADVCDGCGMVDLADENLTVTSLSHGSPVQLNTVSDTSPIHPHPLDIADTVATLPVSPFANDSFGVFTNEYDADTRLSSSCCDTFKAGSPKSIGYEHGVAILPLSSVTDDTVQPPSFRNVHFLSDLMPTNVVEHSRTDQLVARSLSPSEGLVLGERHLSFERPCSRNCSISTNEDGGVFVVDDELEHSVPCSTTVLNADSHLSHTLVRPCNLDEDDDDGEAIRWDGCPSQSGYPVDKATSPIFINSRGGGGGNGSMCHVTLDQGAILASENPIKYQSLHSAQRSEDLLHSTNHVNGARDWSDLSTKALIPSFGRQDPVGRSANHVFGATAELSIDAADYTMHDANSCLLLGDFNLPEVCWADLSCSSVVGTFASDFLELPLQLPLHQSVDLPTRYRSDQLPSTLDLTFVKLHDFVELVTEVPEDSCLTEISITEIQIFGLLQGLNPSKAFDPDSIHPKLVHKLTAELSEPLTCVFTISLDSCALPSEWKKAIKCLIFKGGVRALSADYRPISLTSVVVKLFEKLVRDSGVNHLIKFNFLSAAQHGFRKRFSCLANLLVAREAVDNVYAIDLLFVDFSKAFDTLPHQRLIEIEIVWGIRSRP